ncbi:unnamed protein product [Nezara viridula]|uniref:Uncharacterized protein n=1 Tax=Nezara viridula TaxID=85310 RepID=A0A9P0HP95_NEZVI|nr:unnamed protein product [Nezara viridula]
MSSCYLTSDAVGMVPLKVVKDESLWILFEQGLPVFFLSACGVWLARFEVLTYLKSQGFSPKIVHPPKTPLPPQGAPGRFSWPRTGVLRLSPLPARTVNASVPGTAWRPQDSPIPSYTKRLLFNRNVK